MAHISQYNNQYEMLTPPHPGELDRLLERELFALELVERGMIALDYHASNELDAFGYKDEDRPDALIHTLVGDEFGGGHHLPTIIGMAMEDRVVASRIFATAAPEVKLRTFRQDQRIGQFGVYKAIHVELPGYSGIATEKRRGSTMFPNEWGTQEVIEAVIVVSRQTPYSYNEKRNRNMHVGVVNGVTISVATDPATGRILNANPIRRMAN